MLRIFTITTAAAISLSLLGACTKPAAQTAAADGSASASGAATDAGGAVSPPQANGAVNPDANKQSSDTAAASTSYTEGEARGHIQAAGYSDVTGLEKTPDGLWVGKAKKDGKSVDVAVDFKGAVSTK